MESPNPSRGGSTRNLELLKSPPPQSRTKKTLTRRQDRNQSELQHHLCGHKPHHLHCRT
ncbi:hypothetical protein HanXRQr2_Chr04g0182911 [Helianthus annuus]|uniref:Uncharacterized protein n=1 Tax=Helianthus annuus TaxID=4232 RepID=A0A9K3J9Z0_HELAN|nr:hypothetical protein HanXRQr2_Chr04g0182911 [Helianthus annuus]KAJ0932680.1 hypothetical protein HanPSC8_Chr04g0176411 [Helianthus annuus]